MNQIMTQSKMTPNQVNKLVDLFRLHVEKYGANFDSGVVQTVLDQNGLMDDIFSLLKKRVENFSDTFSHTVTVNRLLTPIQIFTSIASHKQYINNEVVADMPLYTDTEVVLYFFPIKKRLNYAQYQAELSIRNLKADPVAQAVWNQLNRNFSREYPNGTQYINKSGEFCCAAWSDWTDDSNVYVDRVDGKGWGDKWFACGKKIVS
jgi:hypothetical protein